MAHFELSSDRSVSVVSLRQFLHYSGLLEGLPTREMNESTIRRLAAEARTADAREPLVVSPTEEPVAHEGRYPFGQPARIPEVACVARLRSPRPVVAGDYSALTMIWFQDAYAFPLSIEAERALVNLAWDKLAHDYEY